MIWQSQFQVYDPQTESRISKREVHPRVHSSIIHNSREVEVPHVSTHGWTDEYNAAQTYSGTLPHARA